LGRLGWLNDVLPLPVIEVSAYFASIAGVGLIILARGLQRRLDAAYHATVWLLAGGIVFALASNLDIEQAIDRSIMLVILVPSKRFFYRKSSIFEERFTTGWIAAIAVVLLGTGAIALAPYGSHGLGPEVFWNFSIRAQGASRTCERCS
jgi:phosphatidylglycerol lysyltransferase